jgi:hypothetical protein
MSHDLTPAVAETLFQRRPSPHSSPTSPTAAMHPLYPVLILFSIAAAFPGIVIEREDQLRVSYDYVIVGGGAHTPRGM